MAKDKKEKTTAPNQPVPTGPYFAAAVIAEKILTETDGAITVVRIIDRIGIGPISAPEDEALLLPLMMMISFRAGGFKGTSHLMIVQVSPSGTTEPMGLSEIKFDGTPSGGFNVQSPVFLKWEGEGHYWFDVFLDNKFCTRVSLQVALGKLPSAEKSKK